MSQIGAMTALITPFKDGKVDTKTYENLIKRQIENGIDTVVPVGTTGESATLTHDEHKECIEIAVKTTKGTNTKVMAGAGSNSTAEAIDLAKFAQEIGADSILSVTPYYNKPQQEGLYQHYKAIADAIDIDMLLYNVPGRTGVDLLPDTVDRLYNECDNIYGIKEATGSMIRTVELIAQNRDLVVISGDDGINFPLMANGAQGVISVTANLFPDKIAALVNAALAKDYDTAQKINEELLDINTVLFCESNPIPIKAAMYLAGHIETLEYRLPLTPPSESNMQKIKTSLQKYLNN
jgi:4-hydroxy-tetrahydrodipicolinate synthase